MVLAVCRSRLRDPQAAEDAAQETFLNAHRSLLGGTQPRDPAAWLATIARNECSRVRRVARPAPLEEDTAASQLDTSDIVAGRSDLSDVSSAIAALPARQREALVLREFCGLSYDQIAAAMSVSGSAVDALLARARRRIVEQLGEIPRVTHGTLVVPAALREELARLIPGLDAAGAAAGASAGAGGFATLLSLGSAPVGAKVAATCAATVAIAVPMQASVRGDAPLRSLPRASEEARRAPTVGAWDGADASPESWVDNSGHGSGSAGSSGHDYGSGPGGSGSSGHGSGSSGSGSNGSGSGGSGSSGSGSGSSGHDYGWGGHGSGSSGSGSSGSGSGGSGSGGSGSGGSGSDSSGSGSSGSDSDSGGSGSGDSGSGSSDDD